MRIDERDEAIAARAANDGRADVRGALGLVGAAGEVEGDPVALLLDDDVNAHGLLEVDAVVVDEAFGLVAPVVPFGDGRAHALFGKLQQLVEGGERLDLAELGQQFAKAPFAEARGAELAADVAEHEFGRARVRRDDALDLDVALVAALIAHGRQMQALVEDLLRLARARARHRAADVALVRDGAAEADEFARMEHRRDDAHVGRVRAAAMIGMVDEEGVALLDVALVGFDHRAAAGRERADVQRQDDMLRDNVAARVHERAGRVLAFAHDGRIARAEKRVLHFEHDAFKARAHDLDVNGVEGRSAHLTTSRQE